MPDVRKEVQTDFNVGGDAHGKIGLLGSAFSGLGGVISRVTSMFNPLNMAIGALSGVVGVGAISKLGSDFEQTQTVMAGFLSSLGLFKSGYDEAAKIMEDIRIKAAALPGEANEYIEVFKAGLPTVSKAIGGTVQQMAAFTNQYTAVAKTLQVDAGQAARDLDLMLRAGTGQAGMDVRTFTQMLPFMRQVAGYADLSRESFNKMNEQARGKLLQDTFSKLQPMLDASATSFDAMWGAMKSNTKELIRLSSAPLFEGMKKGLERMNLVFYDSNGALTETGLRVIEVGENISKHIVTAVQTAVGWVKELAAAFEVIANSPAMKAIGSGLKAMGETIGGILMPGRQRVNAVEGSAPNAVGGVGPGQEFSRAPVEGGAGGLGGFFEMLNTFSPVVAAITSMFGVLLNSGDAASSMLESLTGIISTTLDVLSAMSSMAAVFGAALGEVIAVLGPPVMQVVDMLFGALSPALTTVVGFLTQMWTELGPPFVLLLQIVAGLIYALGWLTSEILGSVVAGFTALVEAVQWVMDSMFPTIESFNSLTNAVGMTTEALQGLVGWISKKIGASFGKGDENLFKMLGDYATDLGYGTGTRAKEGPGAVGGGARGGGGRANNDFRFSRFEITQKFAEGFDPDRIAVAFAQDVGKIGEQKLQSGFEPLYSLR
jgi:hypothetical protein